MALGFGKAQLIIKIDAHIQDFKKKIDAAREYAQNLVSQAGGGRGGGGLPTTPGTRHGLSRGMPFALSPVSQIPGQPAQGPLKGAGGLDFFGLTKGAGPQELKAMGKEFQKIKSAGERVDKMLRNSTLSGEAFTRAQALMREGTRRTIDEALLPHSRHLQILKEGLNAAGIETGVYGKSIEELFKQTRQIIQEERKVVEQRKKRGKQDRDGKKGTDALTNTFRGAGRTMAWFGFRLMIMGRIMSRFLTKTLNNALKAFTDWEKTISNIGFALGWLAAQGNLTEDAQQRMLDVMTGMPQIAMDFQAASMNLGSAWATLGMDILPMVSDAFNRLADIIGIIWQEHGPAVIATLQKLVDGPLERLFSILETHGGPMLEAFAEGLDMAAGALVWLFEALEPHLPAIAKFLGILLGLAPILTIVGVSIAAMAVPFQLISSFSGPIIKLFSGLKTIFTGLLPFIKGLVSGFISLGPYILIAGGLMEAFGIDTNKILDNIGNGLRRVASWIVETFQNIDWPSLFEGLKTFTSNLLNHMATWLGEAATWALQTFGSIDWLETFRGLETWLNNLWSWALGLMVFLLLSLNHYSISDMKSDAYLMKLIGVKH
jgi:hypothetical protein